MMSQRHLLALFNNFGIIRNLAGLAIQLTHPKQKEFHIAYPAH